MSAVKIQGVIEEIECAGGVVAGIVTDNANNYLAAAQAKSGPGIFQLWCAAHSLDLIFKDVEKHNPVAGLPFEVHF